MALEVSDSRPTLYERRNMKVLQLIFRYSFWAGFILVVLVGISKVTSQANQPADSPNEVAVISAP